ncbi:hypothetical protein FNV43_RR13257 [Rhamnella rubrinervis]|uniref:Uncharacterized protein n=1 Tax=Rhamnella rubrinervis TaxID=2594499 RepID=A0A8K0MEW8_9ROSA|nr:hypothetical protein FNV43_RR13257 [Rhamnella rubrinervis]
MALMNFSASSLYPNPSSSPPHTPFRIPRHKQLCSSPSSSCRTLAQPADKTDAGVTEQERPPSSSGSLSSARTQLDLLEQLTSTSSSVDGYESDGSSGKLTIRDQLAQLVGDRDDDFNIPLGKI